MAELLMPSLGADMAAATLAAWRKRPGERIGRGEIVAEVETEKGLIEIEAFEEGVLDQIVVAPGEKVPVGTVLALIRTSAAPLHGEAAAPAAVTTEPPSSPARAPLAMGAAASHPAASPSARKLARELDIDLAQVPGTGEHGVIMRGDVLAAASPQALAASRQRVRASPLARRRAHELGVHLETIQGTGVLGSIVQRDVERAGGPAGRGLGARDAETEAAAAAPLSALRQAIARAVSRSKREIPHYYLSTELDFSAALRLLEEQNQGRGPRERVTAAALLAWAIARAVSAAPELNGHYGDGGATRTTSVHVGVAISLRGGGLVAPALFEVEKRSLDELAPLLFDLVERARSGGLRATELSQPTITMTSLGDRGVESVFPVIFPPQVAIVGFGRVTSRPWVVGAEVVPRPVLTATLAADHRVSDGHRGGLFLEALKNMLEHPEQLT